ncbi:MAG: hypothetical protein ACYCUY_03565 [Acidithiobacillus sp.]
MLDRNHLILFVNILGGLAFLMPTSMMAVFEKLPIVTVAAR